MATVSPKIDESIFRFILRENYLSITAIGSIFVMLFLGSLKSDIIDPLFHFILSEENFDFMNVTIREGDKPPPFQRPIEIRVGNFFREFVIILVVFATLYALKKLTNFPDISTGNPGVAVV